MDVAAVEGHAPTVAVQLGMAPKTTMHHTSKIYRKLGVRRRGEAVAWARRVGIV